jgi:quinohemoprotein ethanol dehydrogenase
MLVTQYVQRIMIICSAGCVLFALCSCSPDSAQTDGGRATGRPDPIDWPGYGGSSGEQHFSPASEISQNTVGRLGLLWSYDLDIENSVSQPLAINGMLYVTTGRSRITAFRAVSGNVVWQFDPDVTETAGRKLRSSWGSRGIAYREGRLYTATVDGNLICMDAESGQQLWSVPTVDPASGLYVTGAPRIMDEMVIIGNGGADVSDARGYVTAYDGNTGEQLWRFYTVPGNPADGFENDALELAAKTWNGEWWRYGGGGTVWNAITYDDKYKTVYLGVGNGAPWNHEIRSEGEGDNLFLASIVALDADTGAYKWHYQVNPGETWDYNASMDIALATLTIGGETRDVLLQAPKNGFVYVIDRVNGDFISARPFVKTTWASKIDPESGRPVEDPAARFPDGGSFDLFPGTFGAHSWMPMAFSPQTGLVYIPTSFIGSRISSGDVKADDWARYPGFGSDGGMSAAPIWDETNPSRSALTAWNPVDQELAWQVPTTGVTGGGVMATAGGLVFQGEINGTFNAYDASSGDRVWSFDAQAPILAPPIAFAAGGRDYIAIQTGSSTGAAALGTFFEDIRIDYRNMARRVLVFALDGDASLPARKPLPLVAIEDPDFDAGSRPLLAGAIAYGRRCAHCHGLEGVAAGSAPDLRASYTILNDETFTVIVREGALVRNGMPQFEELADETLLDMRHYLRFEASQMRQ